MNFMTMLDLILPFYLSNEPGSIRNEFAGFPPREEMSVAGLNNWM